MQAKTMLYQKCSKCGKITNVPKKEILGIGLILLIAILVKFVGLTLTSGIYILIGLFVGIYWAIKGPSKSVLCDKCK